MLFRIAFTAVVALGAIHHAPPPSCPPHPPPTENVAAQLAKFRPVNMPFDATAFPRAKYTWCESSSRLGNTSRAFTGARPIPQGLALYQSLANCPAEVIRTSITFS